MNIFDVLETRDDVIKGNGVSKEDIEMTEKELELSFASDYKCYLEYAGLLMCDGHEFTGIGSSERTNVVAVTKQMKSLHKDIPNDWYVIENLNIDGALMWQDSKGNVYFNRKKEYESLYEYIINL